MTWGRMTTPPLPMAAAAMAIWSGVEVTSFWPMPVWDTTGEFSAKFSTVPMGEGAAWGRSMGGAELKPKPSAVRTRASPPMS